MVDAALVALLRTHAGIAKRITPSTETALVYEDLPRVIYTRIGTQRRYSDSGDSGLTQARYQLDYFAEHMTDAHEVADAVRVALDGYRGEQAGTRIERVYFDSENFQKGERIEGANKTVARYSQDVIVEYRE